MSSLMVKHQPCLKSLNLQGFFCGVIMVVLASSASADITEAEKALATLIGTPKVQQNEAASATRAGSRIYLAKLDKDIADSIKARKAQTHMTKFGDTLDGIIGQYLSETPIRRSIQRQAVVLANQNAFRRNNPHWMYADREIKLPKIDDYRRAIFKNSAQILNTPLIGNDLKEDWIYYP
tara:strand:+ start:80 stop:616 length:537 start_codon:yes stop_codon:yes gene_type:complete